MVSTLEQKLGRTKPAAQNAAEPAGAQSAEKKSAEAKSAADRLAERIAAARAKKEERDKNRVGRRGRASVFAGTRLTPTEKGMESNPRRKESKRFETLEIIRQNPGISFEDYVKQGGSSTLIHADVVDDLVKVEFPQ